MSEVQAIAFRYLTDADFFNINKPTGSETRGGGQSYIDFPTTDIQVSKWRNFFKHVQGSKETARTLGPAWEFPIHSIGVSSDAAQSLKIYQRRPASVSIAAQKIHSSRSNRVLAWHPTYGFPAPKDPNDRHQLPAGLCAYLVRTDAGEVWAGWFLQGDTANMPSSDPLVHKYLSPLFSTKRKQGDAGMLFCDPGMLTLDHQNPQSAIRAGKNLTSTTALASFATKQPKIAAKKKTKKKAKKKAPAFTQKTRTEDEIIDSLFSEDSNYAESGDQQVVKTTSTIRKRNQRSVSDLKALYEHKCQITGEQYTFKKRDGTNYTEAHHLVPLGDGGADNPLNMIIVSPLIHRMLHYAQVDDIDLSAIKSNPDGSAYLDIRINGKKYQVKWNQKHYEMIMKHLQD